jgi:hypothetical protein
MPRAVPGPSHRTTEHETTTDQSTPAPRDASLEPPQPALEDLLDEQWRFPPDPDHSANAVGFEQWYTEAAADRSPLGTARPCVVSPSEPADVDVDAEDPVESTSLLGSPGIVTRPGLVGYRLGPGRRGWPYHVESDMTPGRFPNLALASRLREVGGRWARS